MLLSWTAIDNFHSDLEIDRSGILRIGYHSNQAMTDLHMENLISDPDGVI